MFSKCLVVLVIYFSYSVLAQISISPCPDFECCKEPTEPAPAESMDGVWYLFGGSLFFFDENTRCMSANLTMMSQQYVFTNISRIDTNLDEVTSYTIFGNYSTDGFFDGRYTDLRFPIRFELIESAPTYLISVACSTCGFFSTKGAGLYVYIYSRTRNPSPETIEAIYSKLQQCGIQSENIAQHNQTGCGRTIVGC